jgi:L-alanine-DL-glutamate epimerase-like enolase superfamily enzyme
MIITGVETFPLRIPFQAGNRSGASVLGPTGLRAVDSLLVKVTTDQGLEGWGESFGFTAVPVTQRAVTPTSPKASSHAPAHEPTPRRGALSP